MEQGAVDSGSGDFFGFQEGSELAVSLEAGEFAINSAAQGGGNVQVV